MFNIYYINYAKAYEIAMLQNNKIKKVYPVEYLEDKINKFIPWHLKSIHLKSKMNACREIKY